jgi:hypothetical protein
MRLTPRPSVWLALSCALFSTGCIGDAIQEARVAAQRAQTMNSLKILGLGYINFIDTNMRGPNDWSEVKQFTGTGPEIQALESAGCIVNWGKTFKDATAGTSQFVIAYLPDAPTAGGPVLMLDGSVQQLTAEEFNALLGAQNAPAAGTPAP